MLLLLPQAQLSVIRAMVGEITPEMRAITVELNAQHVTVRVYHDGLASDDLWDDFDAAMTEVYADFPCGRACCRYTWLQAHPMRFARSDSCSREASLRPQRNAVPAVE